MNVQGSIRQQWVNNAFRGLIRRLTACDMSLSISTSGGGGYAIELCTVIIAKHDERKTIIYMHLDGDFPLAASVRDEAPG